MPGVRYANDCRGVRLRKGKEVSKIKGKVSCSVCGQLIEDQEVHNHLPDIFLNVWDGKYSLGKNREFKDGTGRAEILSYSVPEEWADWILETCGGALNVSGMYPLPGIVRGWVFAMLRGDDLVARNIGRNIDMYLKKGSD